MKVYIITSGEYSDYGIDRIFLDKTKAEEYVRLYQGSYDAPSIEEWDTSDENFYIGKYQIKKYISINYEDKSWDGKEKFNIQLKCDNTENYPNLNNYPYVSNCYSYMNYSREYHNVLLNRPVADDFTEKDIDSLKDKYLKVCRDYVAKAKSLMAEGYSSKQVEEMLF